MARLVLGVVALWFALVGAVMWIAPVHWYENTPGVVLTGPFNAHFVADIALVFAVSAAIVAAGIWRRDRWLSLAGLAWPLMHALYHLWLWLVVGNCAQGELIANLAGIQAPVWAGILAAFGLKNKEGEKA